MKNTLPFNEIREIDIYTSSPQNQNTKSQGKEIQFKNFRNTHEILLRGKTKGTIIIEGFVPNLKLRHEIKKNKKLGFWIFYKGPMWIEGYGENRSPKRCGIEILGRFGSDGSRRRKRE